MKRKSKDIDHAASVDQAKVTSTVEVSGPIVIRTYSDGAVQRLVLDSADMAKDYAASVEGQS